MKKLLVLLVSAALVLSLAAVSLAAATVTGDIKAKYQFNNAADNPSDEFEAAITAAGPVSDNVVGSITFKSDGSIGDNNFFVDAYTFKATFDWGTWTVGKWGYKAKGPVLDICSPIWGDFKATAAMSFDKVFDNGVNIGLWAAFDGDDVAENVGDGAYIGTIGFTNDQFFASAYLINCGDDNVDDDGFAIDKDGFAINLGYTGIENLIVYFNYEDADDWSDEASMILGAKYTYDAFWAMAEIQLNDDYAEDNYGIRLNYTFGNKIYAQYRWVADGTDAGDEDDKSELRIGVAF